MSHAKRKECFNPFNLPKSHSTNVSDLRKFPESDLHKFPTATKDSWLCTTCRKKVKELVVESANSEELSQSLTNTQISSASDCDITIDQLLKICPVKRKWCDNDKYMTDKLNEVHEVTTKKFKSDFSCSTLSTTEKITLDYNEILRNIEESFKNETNKSKKIECLMLLPENWSIRKIQTTLNLKSNHLITGMKKLKEGKVKISVPRKTGLSAENKQLVKEFYERENNSRQMPGKKDVKSIKMPDGTRKLMQKKLILSNLKELYESFKKGSTLKIGFTKFTLLRPQHCVLAGSAGTHTVCVCLYHQNLKLMLEGCNFKTLMRDNEWFDEEYESYSDLLKKFVYLQPTESCYFRICKNCPKDTEIKELIEEVFEQNDIEEISYKAWMSTDRCKLMNVISDTSEFIDSLIETLEKLVQHDYIAKKQSKYYQQLKNNLKEGELLVTLDFSENYAVVIQNAVQGFYWNNTNIAILLSVVYYKDSGSLKNLSFLGVLENTIHDTISVYMFQNRLIELIKLKIPSVNKIYYFTDGAPQHFKNQKNFKNLCLHDEDFGITAEWHFFATAHGKGPCDGLGGMVKSQARKACLQFGSQRNILNASDFYEWGQNKFESVDFIHCSNDDYIQTSQFLQERFSYLRAVKGTLESYTFIPDVDSTLKIRTKTVSVSNNFKVFKIK